MRNVLIATLLIVISVLLAPSAFALGLGGIHVLSKLNEPFRAKIKIVSIPKGDINNLKVSLASPEAFRRAGIEYSHVLSALNFTLRPEGATSAVISVTSHQTIKEPFVSFLIEVNWPSGRLRREYTALLDPPLYDQSPAPPPPTKIVVPSTKSERSVTPQLRKGEKRPSTKASPKTTRQPLTVKSKRPLSTGRGVSPSTPPRKRVIKESVIKEPVIRGGASYTVASNDTLWRIALQTRPRSTSIHQHMRNILRANPQAFIRGNMNLVKAGHILRVPNASSEAIENLRLAASQHVGSQQEPLTHKPTKTPQAPISRTNTDEPGTQKILEAGKQTKLEIAAIENESSNAGSPDSPQEKGKGSKEDDKELQKKLDALNVEKSGLSKENKQLKSDLNEQNKKIAEQDKKIAELNKLFTMRNEEFAKLQKRLAQTEKQLVVIKNTDNKQPAEPKSEIKGPDKTEPPADKPKSTDDKQPAEPKPETKDPDKTEPPADKPKSTDDKQSAEPKPETKDPDKTGPTAAEPKPTDKQPEPGAAPPPGDGNTTQVVDKSTENTYESSSVTSVVEKVPGGWLGIGGVALALLLGGVAVAALQRRKEKKIEQELELLEGNDDDISSVPSDEDEELTDFNKDKPRSTVNEPEEEPVDEGLLEEVEVYMAYGKHDQAEKLLRDALADHPYNHKYRLKLLEVLAAAGKEDELAQETMLLHAMTGGGEREDWRKSETTSLAADDEVSEKRLSKKTSAPASYTEDDVSEKSGSGTGLAVGAAVAGLAVGAGAAALLMDDESTEVGGGTTDGDFSEGLDTPSEALTDFGEGQEEIDFSTDFDIAEASVDSLAGEETEGINLNATDEGMDLEESGEAETDVMTADTNADLTEMNEHLEDMGSEDIPSESGMGDDISDISSLGGEEEIPLDESESAVGGDDMSLDEGGGEFSLDEPASGGDDMSLDLESGEEDLSLDESESASGGDDMSLDLEGGDELSLEESESAAGGDDDLGSLELEESGAEELSLDESEPTAGGDDMSLDLESEEDLSLDESESASGGDDISLDLEGGDELSLDESEPTAGGDDMSLDLEGGDELSLDESEPTAGGDDMSLDLEGGDELSLDESESASGGDDMSLDLESGEEDLSLDESESASGGDDMSLDLESGEDLSLDESESASGGDDMSLDLESGEEISLDESESAAGGDDMSLDLEGGEEDLALDESEPTAGGDDMSLDLEGGDELSLDESEPTAGGDDMSLDLEGGDELSLEESEPAAGGDDMSLDLESGEEISLDESESAAGGDDMSLDLESGEDLSLDESESASGGDDMSLDLEGGDDLSLEELEPAAGGDDMSLDLESGEDLSLDESESASGGDDMSFDLEGGEELSLDEPTAGEDDMSFDLEAGDELSLDTDPSSETELSSDELDMDALFDEGGELTDLETTGELELDGDLPSDLDGNALGDLDGEMELGELEAVEEAK